MEFEKIPERTVKLGTLQQGDLFKRTGATSRSLCIVSKWKVLGDMDTDAISGREIKCDNLVFCVDLDGNITQLDKDIEVVHILGQLDLKQ